MEISPVLLLTLLLICICLGGAVGMWCDVFRLLCSFLKRKVARWRAARFFGDVGAVLLAALGVIVFSYYFNNATVRGFCYIGVAVGFFVYRRTLTYPFCALLRVIICILFTLLRIISIPFAKIFTFAVKILKKILIYLVKVLEKAKVLVYNSIKYKYIVKRSKKGFL